MAESTETGPAVNRGVSAVLRTLGQGTALQRRERLRALAITLALPPALLFTLGQAAGLLLPLLAWSLALGAPALVLFRVLVPWATGERGLLAGLAQQLTLLPASDLRWRNVPWVTLGLIALDSQLFLAVAQPWRWGFGLRNPGLLELVACMFLHGSRAHLFGNMVFLWMFGSALEPRLGAARFFALYLACGVIASLSELLADFARGEPSLGIGASGAISGVLGLFMIRCLRSRVMLPLPLLPLAGPWGLYLRVQLPAPLLLTAFTLADLSGALGPRDGTAHWAHLGGYYAGLAFGACLGLLSDGLHEHLAERGVQTGGQPAQPELLDEALALRPDDAETWVARARWRSRGGPSSIAAAAQDYRRAIALVRTRSPEQAAGLFAELFRLQRAPLEPAEQLALTPALAKLGEREIAARALEAICKRGDLPAELEARALLTHARLLVELGCPEPAQHEYERLLARHPAHPGADAARAYLAQRGLHPQSLRGPVR